MSADMESDLINSVRTITQQDWSRLSTEERRQMFSKHTIHVIGENKDKVLTRLNHWEDWARFHTSFDLQRPLHVHGE